MIHEAGCDGACLGELIERVVGREFGAEGLALLDGMRRPGCVRVVAAAAQTCACGRVEVSSRWASFTLTGAMVGGIQHTPAECGGVPV